jgi:hypothetical protein
MVVLMRRVFPGLAALLVLATLANGGTCCPFCTMQGKTLTGDVSEASMVLYGKLTNANEKNNTTDIQVEMVVKDNAVRGNRKHLTLSRFVDLDRTGPNDRFLVFCDLFKGTIDPFRGVALKSGSKMPEYLRKAVEVKDKPAKERLRFYFDYLDNEDPEISNDAYKEFGNADYQHFKEVVKEVPIQRVVKWLKDKNTPTFRIGLYSSMVGHAGKETDAKALRDLLDNAETRAGSGVDGLLAGYAMLKPKEGWPYLLEALKNTKEDFMFRYAALRAVRFLHDFKTDVVAKKDLVGGVCLLLKQEDIADLAIEDLRKWQAWDVADKVLAVAGTDAYKLPIVKRAILRYCLQCKDNAKAKAHVEARRKADAEAVKEAEELLKLEQETTTPPPAPGTTKK